VPTQVKPGLYVSLRRARQPRAAAVPATIDVASALLRYRGLVSAIAERQVAHLPPGMEPDDLIGEGLLVLAEAARCFDPAQGVRFTSYACPLIYSGMKRAMERWEYVIHLPFNRLEKLRRLRDAREWAHAAGRSTTTARLAETAGVSEAEASELLSLADGALSLDALWESGEWEDARALTDAWRGLTEEQRLLKIVVRDALAELSWLKREVLILRYGLDGRGERLHREIAAALGICREYARDLEAAARAELKERLAGLEA
jgi:RNA polymerase primary sigma factor